MDLLTLPQLAPEGLARAIVVTGGRDFRDGEMVRRALSLQRHAVLAHGTARGADTLAADVGRQLGVHVADFPADWRPKPGGRVRRRRDGQLFDPDAGFARNDQMMATVASWPLAALCIAFPGGGGTLHATKAAEREGLPIWRPATGEPPPLWRPPPVCAWETSGRLMTPASGEPRRYGTPIGPLPSVTTILDATLPEPETLTAWRERVGVEVAEQRRVEAVTRGEALHANVETFFYRGHPRVLKAVEPFWRSIFPELERLERRGGVVGLEMPLWHPEGRFAGTADALFLLDGELVLFDWKTSAKRRRTLSESYPLQVAAYAAALRRVSRLPVTRAQVVVAIGDGGPPKRLSLGLPDLQRLWGQFMVLRRAYPY